MKIFTQNQVGEVLNRLYDSEINAKIEWFWDAGFKIAIGDFTNGWAKKTDFPEFEELNFRRINEAISGLAFWAAAIYPESEFAKWYMDQKTYMEMENAAADGRLIFIGSGSGKGVLDFENDSAAGSACNLYIEPVENSDTWIKNVDNIKGHTLTLRFSEQKQNDWNPLD